MLRFADPLDGYVFESRSDGHHPLWVTHDGGRNWKRSSLHGLLAFATAGGHAFALVGSCSKGACTQVALMRSSVRRDAWTALHVPLPAVVPGTSMAAHGSAVWITASVPTTARAHQTLLVSTDAGTNFVSAPSPCTSALGGTLAASTPPVVWAVCPTGTQAMLYRSLDGGRSWSQLQTPPLANSAIVAPKGRTTAIVATGATSQLLRTTDGGRKFSAVFTASTAKGHWTYVGFTGRSAVSGLLAVATSPSGTSPSGTSPSGTSPSGTSPSGTAPSGTAGRSSPSTSGTSPSASLTAVPFEQLWHSKDAGAIWAGPVQIGP